MKKKIKTTFFEFGRKNTVKRVFFISQLWSLLDRLKVVTFKPSLIPKYPLLPRYQKSDVRRQSVEAFNGL
jgi:hypothetical protein